MELNCFKEWAPCIFVAIYWWSTEKYDTRTTTGQWSSLLEWRHQVGARAAEGQPTVALSLPLQHCGQVMLLPGLPGSRQPPLQRRAGRAVRRVSTFRSPVKMQHLPGAQRPAPKVCSANSNFLSRNSVHC